ncbi:sugar phosphate isomerase/epimerase family protein [Maledivibacter halophilus]|uniref:D-psicose/D-tagatose/L-ribulose 3-epimerase n=1 Tax=Maledivibacter halophilus TaxID=36842 RepID=A0A1T5MNR6_9FIRM|nr:sugar phosphate isomerase/epimerase family protein [Maledivibacter halophilus]SKC89664.1 D-psicose/D-tagatose/L-ribulose 3-epimerase [Maledivibacter halophilus]
MKFGIHLSTFTREWSEDLLQYIPVVKEYGYDGVEIPLMSPDELDLIKIKKLLNQYKLQCTCGTGMNPQRDISSANWEIRQNGIEHLKKCINISSELNSDCLAGVLYAPWGQLKMRSKAKDDIKRSLDALNEIGRYADEKGVVLAIEILNRYESYFMNTVREGKEYLKKINNDNIKLHFDTFHSNIEEKNIYQAIVEGGKDIYHIHFCENDRGIPGSGSINWEEVKRGINDIAYDRWIILENFVMPECGVGRDVYIWREIEKSGSNAAEKGIKFMKNLFGEV